MAITPNPHPPICTCERCKARREKFEAAAERAAENQQRQKESRIVRDNR